jgi:protease I
MQEQSAQALQGKRVAILMTDGVEQVEYTGPRGFLEGQGASVTLLSPKAAGEDIQGFDQLTPAATFKVERDVRGASHADFDMLVLPGGVANPDQLRLSSESIAFIRAFGMANKPIASICHGPWTLIDAELVTNRRMTSWPTLQVDLENAGAKWTDEQVVVDGKLVTSRKPDDIPAFNQAILAQLQAVDQTQQQTPQQPWQ